MTWPQTLDDFGPRFRQRGDQINFQVCPVCGDRRWKVYLAPESGMWICFAGVCGASGKISTSKETDALMEMLRPQPVKNEGWAAWPEVDFPETAWSCAGFNAYLRSRGIPDDGSDGLGLREGGIAHGGRAIIPFFDPAGRLVYWTTRDYCGRDHVPKYLGMGGKHPPYVPRYSSHGGRGSMSNGCRSLVLVEGPFDAIQVHQAGYPVAALGGTVIPKHFRSILLDMAKDKLVLFLDHDALAKAVRLARDLAGLREVDIVRPPKGKDPGDLTPTEIKEILG